LPPRSKKFSSLPTRSRSTGTAATGDELQRLEAELAALWAGVLDRDRVGRDENFFDLGGNSLLLVTAQTAINKALGSDLGVVDLFAHPTVRALARHLAERGATAPAATAPGTPAAPAAPSGLHRAKEQAQRQRAARTARRSARERKDRRDG
jgi:aryl carrier-like protein